MTESHDGRRTVLLTVGWKLAALVAGGYFAVTVYRSGLEWVAYAVVLGGGGAALGVTLSDLREGRKPWLPVERKPAVDRPYPRSAIVGVVLGKVTAVALGLAFGVVLYRAGLERLVLTYGTLVAGYAVVRTAIDWRNGCRPWHPKERVQRRTQG